MYSVRASRIIFVILAATNILPPSTVSGAAASTAFSSSESTSRAISSACCINIRATNFCSCSLAVVFALARSTWALFRRARSCESSESSDWSFLSLCLSIRNFRASGNLACASFSASRSLSQNSCASSGWISSTFLAARGVEARIVF